MKNKITLIFLLITSINFFGCSPANILAGGASTGGMLEELVREDRGDEGKAREAYREVLCGKEDAKQIVNHVTLSRHECT